MLASTDRSSCPRKNTGTIGEGKNTYFGRPDELLLLIAFIQLHSPLSLAHHTPTAVFRVVICYRVGTKSATEWEQNLLQSGNKICYRVGTKSATAWEQMKVGLKVRSFNVALRPPRPYERPPRLSHSPSALPA